MGSFPLYLLRHGAPLTEGRLLGHGDEQASPAGIAACAAQAEGLGPVRLVSSDLARARACAEAIGTPQLDPRWRELDFGAWDGLTAAEVEPAALARFWDDPDLYPPPGGEGWSALAARVAEAVAALPAEPTLVVTHGGAMRAALHGLCGLSLAQTWSFELPCASLLALTVWEGSPRRAQIAGLWP
ncbi:histidine phosphatase family protein [Sphingomonas jatrophae]|uniref:Alpha-ribazole phosphatase n=1 Tax=Sphingomonas jatrophae TaxID=1166337 RepID=A0A1I6JBG8_9SPHN|nr:histidine phosphatase family protein [Sphingomonas jatrophae]SFR76335.1 alpha-ribazole phosphatase [Sphingomonas jatrophae]